MRIGRKYPAVKIRVNGSGLDLWCTDNGRAGLPRNGANVRNMIEMRVRDEDRFGLRHVGRLEAKHAAPRRAVEIGIEQVDLALVAEFEIGVGEQRMTTVSDSGGGNGPPVTAAL